MEQVEKPNTRVADAVRHSSCRSAEPDTLLYSRAVLHLSRRKRSAAKRSGERLRSIVLAKLPHPALRADLSPKGRGEAGAARLSASRQRHQGSGHGRDQAFSTVA